MRSALRAGALVLLSLLAAVLLAGCGGSGDRVLTLDGLAKAAASSADASTGRFTFAMEMTAPDGYDTVSFTGYGFFDSAAEQAHVHLDLSSLASLLAGLAGASGGGSPELTDAELWQIEVIQDGLQLYMRFPLLARVPSGLPGGKPWVRIDLQRAAEMQGLDLEQLRQFTSNDPRDALRYLRAVSGDLQVVGDEELHGIDTSRYRTEVDLLRYKNLVRGDAREKLDSLMQELVTQSGLRRFPVEVWVDDEDLIHKVTMSMSATPPGAQQTFEVAIRYELYDYGDPVSIQVPSPAKVVDALELGKRS